MRSVLVVDDDPRLADLVGSILASDGYTSRQAADVGAAFTILKSEDVLVCLLGLRLGIAEGAIFLQKMSQEYAVGTIILSECADVMDRVAAFEAGADAHMVKPIHARELTARVKQIASRVTQLRDGAGAKLANEKFRLGRWLIDPVRFTATSEFGTTVCLTLAEAQTLQALVRKRGTVLSRDVILSTVTGGRGFDPTDRRVDVFVARIRKKLSHPGDGEIIRTIHRLGYSVD